MNVKVYTTVPLLFTTVQTLFKHMESQTGLHMSGFTVQVFTSLSVCRPVEHRYLIFCRLVIFMNSGLVSEAYQCLRCITSVIQRGLVQLMVAG